MSSAVLSYDSFIREQRQNREFSDFETLQVRGPSIGSRYHTIIEFLMPSEVPSNLCLTLTVGADVPGVSTFEIVQIIDPLPSQVTWAQDASSIDNGTFITSDIVPALAQKTDPIFFDISTVTVIEGKISLGVTMTDGDVNVRFFSSESTDLRAVSPYVILGACPT